MESSQESAEVEERLPGGRDAGAVLVRGTVRRPYREWTPTVHELLRHLEKAGFDRAPRVLGVDAMGREILSYVPGTTVGAAKPWPPWVHSDDALRQVAEWLRDYHVAAAGFVPPPGAIWRRGEAWRPGLIICHNDGAPYNAAWADGRLTGFFDWDFAGPCTPVWDLAFFAFSWVPLHARHIVLEEGFTAFVDRPRRLRLFLDAYGWAGPGSEFVEIVRERMTVLVAELRRCAAAGVTSSLRAVARGIDRSIETAVREMADVRCAD